APRQPMRPSGATLWIAGRTICWSSPISRRKSGASYGARLPARGCISRRLKESLHSLKLSCFCLRHRNGLSLHVGQAVLLASRHLCRLSALNSRRAEAGKNAGSQAGLLAPHVRLLLISLLRPLSPAL